jgi:hypothetical protein
MDGIVCSIKLRKFLYTVGAIDNLDHNSSSLTAKGSFHGTGISIFQAVTESNKGESRGMINFTEATGPIKLPSESINQSIFISNCTVLWIKCGDYT